MNILANYPPTEELQAIDSAHHMHPFTHNSALADKGARVITSAKGVWLKDSEGEEIIDGMAGLWCVNIGYGRTELAEAAARQMRELPFYNTFFQTTTVPALMLAKKLAELAPGDLNNVFFANGGSDANDTNLRMVRTYWAEKGQPDRDVVISRWNAYHGSSMGSASLGGMKGMHGQGGLPIPGITYIDQPDWWSEGGDMTPEDFGLERAQQLEAKIKEIGPEKVAAFIAEPIQGAGGVIIPPTTYWPEIQRICKKYDILLIADEVICAFGRTGNWFGSQTLGIQPDIMTVAKGLSSGYIPIGASIVSDRVAAVIRDTDFNHGYTYSGHPVACAVALENLRIIEEEDIINQVRNVTGPYLRKKWEALADHPLVGEAKIVGMIGSIALTPDKASRAAFAVEGGAIGLLCRDQCFANNIIMRSVDDRMVISPPLTITCDEIDILIARAIKSLDETYAKLKAGGMLVSA
ncbi:aspartate aminotransferase family protein [Yoonia sp.]|uniref:aspartate aminotransferase family protein n=1 Tax=Yoonia sp. TaxID=2212373 RepID=UPI00236A02F6|nr:aspartate aminotransferase family protein [Yoonia sp.]MDB4111926.1 aspartate aminotransferase family protein [Yoonia sp.]